MSNKEYMAALYLRLSKEDGDKEESDSILTITISTLNYGIVNVTLILETSNSVQVQIECNESFPKQEIKLRIEKEQKFYAMNSVLNFETNNKIKENPKPQQSAMINSSQTTEINPYLLLMAHTIIKQILDIDNNKTLGIESHIDKH